MNTKTDFTDNASADVAVFKDAILVAGADTLIAKPVELRWSTVCRFSPLRGIGVRTQDGLIATHGTDIYRHRKSSPLELGQIEGQIDSFEGRAFYGGIVGPQFGHLLTQSLGRLWAAEPDVPILFLNANPGFTEIPSYFIELLRLLNVHNPLRLVTNHMRVSELIVAKEHANLDRKPSVTPVFADWLAVNRPNVALDPNLSIYVSRSKLDPKLGQFLQETVLEAALQEHGYTVIYPETLPLATQIDLYTRAKRLIFADGSAIHLWSLFAHQDQLTAMVLRRQLHRQMANWFVGLPQARPQFIDCRMAAFSGRRNASWLSVALLDMDQLWRRLRRRGFHRSRKKYYPPRTDLMTWLAAVETGQDPITAAPFELDAVTRALLTARPRLITPGTTAKSDVPTDHIRPPHPLEQSPDHQPTVPQIPDL